MLGRSPADLHSLSVVVSGVSSCLQLFEGSVQVEVSLGQYLSHVSSSLRDFEESAVASGSEIDLDQLMTQLSELDKMGQEGAKPVDDAEAGICNSQTGSGFSYLICKSTLMGACDCRSARLTAS